MVDNVIETNNVRLVGKIIKGMEESHEIYGEKFYNFTIEVPRLSSSVDNLQVTISERILFNIDLDPGIYVIIEGQLRSYNRVVNERNKLILTVFVRDLIIPEEEELAEFLRNPNEIYLDGYICKKPIYRTTPFGREISDILLAVNRPYNKSDYIPAIAWGRNARFCENLVVGDRVKVWGRIQSREYQKKLGEEEVESRVAYEVSLSKLEYLEDENNRL